jgi:hypothetical protein
MTAESPRLIAHLDMDAFYASVDARAIRRALVAAAGVGPAPQAEHADPTPSLFDAAGWE